MQIIFGSVEGASYPEHNQASTASSWGALVICVERYYALVHLEIGKNIDPYDVDVGFLHMSIEGPKEVVKQLCSKYGFS